LFLCPWFLGWYLAYSKVLNQHLLNE
jgi:hypothetical protein